MAFYPNKNLDYRTRIQWAPVPDSGAFSSTSILGTVQFPYGIPVVSDVAGFEVKFECSDPVYGTFDTTLTIKTPGADYSDTAAGGVERELWVYFDNALMSVDPDCDGWAFSASKIGFYGDEERTEIFLELTDFEDFASTGYDRRDLVQKWSALVVTALPVDGSPVPGCTSFNTMMTSAFIDCFWELSAVGEENWIRKPLEQYEIETPGVEVECTSCEEPVPVIEIEGDYSFGFVGDFEAALSLEEVTVPCPCIIPEGADPVLEPFDTLRGEWHFSNRGVNFWPAPTDFRLTDLEINTLAYEWCCEGAPPSPVEEDDTISEAKTYCQLTVSVLNSQGIKWCPVGGIQFCSNGLPFGGTCAGVDECCSYYAEHSAFWSYVGCPEPSSNWLSADVSTSKLHIVAIGQDGDVRMVLQDHDLSEVLGTDHFLGADSGSVAFDKASNPLSIWLFTEISGEIFAQKSTDCGQTLSSATKIGDGMKPDACISLSGIQFVYWFDGTDIKGRRFDRAGTALEAAFTVVSGVDEDGLACTVATIAGGISRVVLRYFVGGTLTTKTSVDGITFS